MNDDTANPYRICRIPHASRGIPEQRAADALPMPTSIHGQAGQHGNWNAVRHVPPESVWSAGRCYHARSQRVITNHVFFVADNIGT